MSERLWHLLSGKLDEIAALYKVRPRITLIVRVPGKPKECAFLSDDSWADAVATVRDLHGDPTAFAAGPPEPVAEAPLAPPPAPRADMERWLTEGMLSYDEAEAIRAELHRLWSPPARDEVREAAEKLLREARNECLQRAPTGFGRARCRDWMRDRAKWCALCRGDAFLSALARPAKGDA